jgi:BirA family transcriptional regulator, biotin operon repressor / biotin---[acetyl-CoA-carboxylase] ligase
MPVTPRLYHYERVGSTMDVLHQLAADGAPAGTVVMAGEQLEGRGSRGRPWHSPPGGLWLSALFRPPASEGMEVISLRVGLAIADSLEPLVATEVRLKWPNDLMLNDRKVGGILCEARWHGGALGWVAVGIGLNVCNRISPDLTRTAVSLAEERPGLTVDETAGLIVTALRQVDLSADRLSQAELARFARRDWLRGREIRSPLSGTVLGLSDDGALLVRTSGQSEIPVRNGSVELATVSSIQ